MPNEHLTVEARWKCHTAPERERKRRRRRRQEIRPWEAKSKVGTHRRAGKLGDVKCFTRKSTRHTEAR